MIIPSSTTSLLKKRNLLLFDEINITRAKEIISQVLFLANHSSEPITLNICSHGGDVYAGLAIIDTLHATACTIKTLCMGQACSVAAVLLAAGTKGQRYITKHSRMMIHTISGGCTANAPDSQRQYQELQRSNQLIVNLLAEYTKKDNKQISEDISRDYWLDAEQSIAYGLTDHII